jgi:hypothetical protein
VASTLDRLELSRAVLQDNLDQPAPAPAPAPTPQPGPPPVPAPQPQPGPQPQPAPRPAPARARLVATPRAHGRAVAYGVRCLSGRCRVTATLRARGRTVGRRTTALAAGRRRTVTVALNPAGRRLLARRGRLTVTVRVTLGRTTLARGQVKVR